MLTWTGVVDKVTGQVTWVRVGTAEGASSQTPRDGEHFRSVGISTGARPKKGETCYKPSESLLHDLQRVQDDSAKEAIAKKKERIAQIGREFDAGIRKMDPDVRMGMPIIAVPEDNGATRYVPAERVPEDDRARIERLRESKQRAEAELAAALRETPGARSQAGISQVVQDTYDPDSVIRPTEPPKHLDQAAFLSWDAATARNDAKRVF